MFPTPDSAPPAFWRNGHRDPASAPSPISKRPRSTRPNWYPTTTRHRLRSASSLSCGVHVSPPGTRRFTGSRGPPASLSPAPRRSQCPQSHTALGSDSPYCCRGLHRQGLGQGPHSEAARVGLSVPGAPPSWPPNTQRSSDSRRRLRVACLAQPIVGRELQLPEDNARLRIPEGRAVRPTCAGKGATGLAREPGSGSRFKRSLSGMCYRHTMMFIFSLCGGTQLESER